MRSSRHSGLMTSRSRAPYWKFPATLIAIAMLGGCASPAAPGAQPPAEIAAHGEVVGQGTVLQQGDSAPQFCVGAVTASYPPLCSGPDVVGWDWTRIEGHETAGTVTWGAYVINGRWDGKRLTVTQPPMMLALYDPLPIIDPYLNESKQGKTSDSRLADIQKSLNESRALRPLSSSTENGYLFVDYLYDAGDIQKYLDNTYGKDVVIVRPTLRDVTP